MKNRKTTSKTVRTKIKIALVTLIVFTVLIVEAVTMVGCSCSGNNEPIDVQVQNALQDVLNVAMSEDEEPDELLVETESRSGYEVLSYTETESGVIVTFLVHAPDLYTVAKEIDENYEFETEEERQSAVIDAVGRAEIIEQEVTLTFVKTDKGYEPILTEEFFDAYYGGILKLFSEAIDKMTQEVAE